MIPLTLSVLLLLTLTAALSGFSLRDFSRSRLETLCNEAEVPDRFSEILRSHPTMLLAADLFWLTGVILISIIFTHKYLEVPRNFSTPAVTIQFSIQILLILLTGILLLMVIPWTISRIAGERFLQLFWPVIKLLPVFLSPVIWLCWKIDEFSHRLAGKEDNKNGREANISEEILSVVEEGARGGILESEAGKMIQRVMELQDEDVGAIMTQRMDMEYISVNATLDEALLKFIDVGHSRIPVIGESTDDIVGILYARELLKHFSKENQNSESPEELTIQKLMFSPFYIPETTGIDSLLETMQKEHVHMAIVIDEYGGVAGLVTMEDVLEEIVGDIVDEFDEEEEQMIFETGQNTLEVDARVHIDDLNEQYNYNLPEGKDFDTIGGFVITQIGKVPQPGETLTWQQLRIEVLESDERRINKLRIELDTSLVEEYDTDN
ncbi:transporter associated domain-containing protein [Gimesia maris]|uniref:Magnesium and cobalt efflux protein CorC n=1 Tax=Gimesia maris TaxID=122 RepID=A0ABX5YLJ9_9PLAN|nr:hemolysin family protein [Gimesia maris]EDL57930.1 hemolysin protein [Gimesia maris DSM 8797]QEG16492.1 Magnesium and cobalt efflux protein CorC [Gimesia maris]QGQ30325.1 HlyC/CorC family transporter [Gimesia maris]